MRFFIITSAVLALATPSLAQTMMTQPSQSSLPPNAPPIPAGSVEQAKRQLKGDFDNLARPDYGVWVGGQIQKAWSKSGKKKGIFVYRECPKESCVYKLRAREWMVSTIILPRDTQIHGFDIGDPAGFQARQRASNILALQPARGGMDTSLQIYTEAGEVYSFYVRAESFNSKNIPDLVVRIDGHPSLADAQIIQTTLPHPGEVASDDIRQGLVPDNCGGGRDFGQGFIPDNCGGNHQGNHQTGNQQGGDLGDLAKQQEEKQQEEEQADFIKSVPFNPDRLHGWADYELYGGDGSDKLRPEQVFRDDIFTYIQFGDHWDGIDLPTAYVVVDGLDELVNTRIEGHTYIIESTAKLITLKSGETYLCIKYAGDDG